VVARLLELGRTLLHRAFQFLAPFLECAARAGVDLARGGLCEAVPVRQRQRQQQRRGSDSHRHTVAGGDGPWHQASQDEAVVEQRGAGEDLRG
jgi:hypothetical protein